MSTPIIQPAARQLLPALRMLLVLTVLCGLAYPLLMLGHFGLLAASGIGSSVTWRGIRYRLLDRNATEIVSRPIPTSHARAA